MRPTVKIVLAQTPASHQRPDVMPLEVTLRLDRAGWEKVIASAQAGLAAASGPDETVDVVVLGYSRDGR